MWAIQHSESGYVQGINDLVTPFFQVFLSVYIGSLRCDLADIDVDPVNFDPGTLPKEVLDSVEADSFWCLSALLDGIQVFPPASSLTKDNYIIAQPGIQRMVATLRELITRIDAPLARHLNEQGIEFIQFSFRWMNCLLMREFSIKNVIRMWDTYAVHPLTILYLTIGGRTKRILGVPHIRLCSITG